MARNASLARLGVTRCLKFLVLACALAEGANTNAASAPAFSTGSRTFKTERDERLVRVTITSESEGRIVARIDQAGGKPSEGQTALDVNQLRPWDGPVDQRLAWRESVSLEITNVADTVTAEISVGEDTLRIAIDRRVLADNVRATTSWTPVLLEINGVAAWIDETSLWQAVAAGLEPGDPARAALEDLAAAFADFERFKREFMKLQILLQETRSLDFATIGTRSCVLPCWRCATSLGASTGTLVITLAGCSTAATGFGLMACLGGIGITSIRFMDAAMQCSECDHCLQRQRNRTDDGDEPDSPLDGDGCDPCEPTEGCPPATCNGPIP